VLEKEHVRITRHLEKKKKKGEGAVHWAPWDGKREKWKRECVVVRGRVVGLI
jgi:hypothetical protein